MKSLLAIAILVATVCMTNPNASAQEHGVQATVPFSFNFGSSHLAAGTYILNRTTESHILSIRNVESGTGVLALTMPIESADNNRSSLVFHKYGNQYFLSEVRCASCSMNVHMPQTKEEKRARVQVQEAGLFPSDPILIALK